MGKAATCLSLALLSWLSMEDTPPFLHAFLLLLLLVACLFEKGGILIFLNNLLDIGFSLFHLLIEVVHLFDVGIS